MATDGETLKPIEMELGKPSLTGRCLLNHLVVWDNNYPERRVKVDQRQILRSSL